jgi:hypothetical protein
MPDHSPGLANTCAAVRRTRVRRSAPRSSQEAAGSLSGTHVASEQQRQVLHLEGVALVAHTRRRLVAPAGHGHAPARARLTEDTPATAAVMAAQQQRKGGSAAAAAQRVAVGHPVRRWETAEAAERCTHRRPLWRIIGHAPQGTVACDEMSEQRRRRLARRRRRRRPRHPTGLVPALGNLRLILTQPAIRPKARLLYHARSRVPADVCAAG